MTDVLETLNELGEFFAAGFMEQGDAPIVLRMAHGIRNHLERSDPPPYDGEPLYPTGQRHLWNRGAAVWHCYVLLRYHRDRCKQKRDAATTDEQRAALDALDQYWSAYPSAGGYTHSIPHFGRIAAEGLESYGTRIQAGLEAAQAAGDAERQSFYQAMAIVLKAVRDFHRRSISLLVSLRFDDSQKEANRQRLVDALKHVPFGPATSFYEAMAGTNFIFYLDGCDSVGRFDQDLWPAYAADLAEGRIDRATAVPLVRAFWQNIDTNNGWNVAIGGTREDGTDGSNELTLVAIEAARNIRRPNLALRLRRDTPDPVWDEALNTILTSAGLPALYCEENYAAALHEAHLNLRERDLHRFAFGGCTETMVSGLSNCGSLDHVMTIPAELETVLHQHLAESPDYDTFLGHFHDHLRRRVRQMTDEVSAWQRTKAEYHPQLIRSLLIDDCIENGREYNAGGARYCWSVVHVGGMANVIDSLAAVRELVFDKKELTAQELLDALKANFEGHELLRQRIERCPRFGNADPQADEFARELSAFVFGEFGRYAPWRGGRFLPSCLMFTTYANVGRPIGALPDGRLAGEPVADSAGAHQGRDVKGPTSLLNSVVCLDHCHAAGTLVVNIRLSKKMFDTAESRDKIKALIRSYFEMGGMQIQVNVVDQDVLRDAIAHPDRHRDLIIRVGGYSEYFVRLGEALQRSVLLRTEHEA